MKRVVDGLKNNLLLSGSHTPCLESNHSKVGILRQFREPHTERDNFVKEIILRVKVVGKPGLVAWA